MLETTLKKLISFKTLSQDHKENLALLKWYNDQFKNLPVFSKFYSVGGFPSLLVTTQKTKKPKVLLAAHTDIVNGSSKLFKLNKIGSKLFGRGTFDMKFAAASYLEIFKSLRKDLDKYNIGILLTTDEEIGGQNGVNALLKKGLSTKFCIIPDGGYDWTVEEGAKGAIQMQVESFGVSAHGSRVWQGKNAIDQLTNFLDQVRELFPSEPCDNKDHWHNTYNLGSISGGLAANSIPDYAIAKINIRLTEQTSISRIIQQINKIKIKFPKIKLKVLTKMDPYEIMKQDLLFKKFILKLEQIRKKKTVYIKSHGACDSRYFLAKGIPVVSLRPIGGGHHSEQEWIDAKALVQFTQTLTEFLLENAKK